MCAGVRSVPSCIMRAIERSIFKENGQLVQQGQEAENYELGVKRAKVLYKP